MHSVGLIEASVSQFLCFTVIRSGTDLVPPHSHCISKKPPSSGHLDMQGHNNQALKSSLVATELIIRSCYCKIKNLFVHMTVWKTSFPTASIIKRLSDNSSLPLPFSLSTTEASEHVISYVWFKLCYWIFSTGNNYYRVTSQPFWS